MEPWAASQKATPIGKVDGLHETMSDIRSAVEERECDRNHLKLTLLTADNTSMIEHRLIPEMRTTSHKMVIQSFIRSPEDWDLNAPYQRGHVWDEEQQRGLIKSLCIGLPIPAIIYSARPVDHVVEHGGADYRVIDGKQRLTAMRAFFVEDKFSVPAGWFNVGLRPDDAELTEPIFGSQLQKRSLLSFTFPVVEAQLAVEYTPRGDGGGYDTRHLTPEELLAAEAAMFVLINSAGTSVNPDELEAARQMSKGTSFD